MAGRTDAEIVEAREKAVAELEGMGYEVVNTLFTDEWYSDEAMEGRGVVQIPLCYLAKSLENMSLCHVAYFCPGLGGCPRLQDRARRRSCLRARGDVRMSDEERREVAERLRKDVRRKLVYRLRRFPNRPRGASASSM